MKILLPRVVFLTTFLLTLSLACNAQCPLPWDNFQNFEQYDITPPTQGASGTQSVYSAWGGDYFKVDVVAGETYEISMCGNVGRYVNDPTDPSGWLGQYPVGHPSGYTGGGYNISWDPQMTIANGATGVIEGFSDDYCDVFPQITYVATFTGELLVALDSSGVCDQFEVDSAQIDVTWLFSCIETSNTINASSCGSYTVPSGNQTYNMSGTYNDTVPNVAGCDSVITINLTITPPDDASFNYSSTSYCSNEPDPDPNITGLVGGTFSGTTGLSISPSTGTIDVDNSTPGTYTITYVTSGACPNSSINNVTVNSASTGVDNQIACDSYTWIDGNTYTASNNTATHLLTNAVGCDSTVTLNLTITTIDPSTSLASDNITIQADMGGASYQWIDCANGNMDISGATQQSYSATANGGYAVIVTMNNCSDTSGCSVINTISLDNLQSNPTIVYYPNPTLELVHLEFGKTLRNVEIVVLDIHGKIIERRNDTDAKNIDLKLTGKPGMYFIRISANELESQTLRVLKKR